MATDPPLSDGAPAPAAPLLTPALAVAACAACGAAARWDAARSTLGCPYCGTTVPASLGDDGAIVAEHDVLRVLRAIPEDARDWSAERVALQCGRCGAISLFEPGRVAQRCDFCGAAAIAPTEATARPIRPDAVLPFSVSEADARQAARRRLGRGGAVTSVTGVYVPYWRMTCDLYVRWHCLGDYGTRERPDYTPIDGGFSEIDDSHLVPATKGVAAGLLDRITPFPLDQLRPYDPGFVAGWVVEQYQIDLVAAGDRLCGSLVERAPSTYRRRCHMDIPVRRYQGLAIAATAAVTAFHHLLLPVWVIQATDGRRTRHVAVNGATGAVAADGVQRRGAGLVAVAVLVLLAWALWVAL